MVASHSAQSNLWFWRCQKCEKLMNDDGRTMDNRPWHKLTRSKALGELIISDQNHFSKSESLCCSDASHQVWAQSRLLFGRRSFEEFQDGHRGDQLGCLNGTNLAVLNPHVSPMPPTKFQLNSLPSESRCHFKIFLERMNLAILNLHVTEMPALNVAYQEYERHFSGIC